jgi:hypothetical protein
MERKKDGTSDKQRVRFADDGPQKERTNKKLQSNSEKQQKRDREEKRKPDEGSDDEEQRQLRTQAEKSRRKKRRMMANVDEDSADSGEGYEGEELDEKVLLMLRRWSDP